MITQQEILKITVYGFMVPGAHTPSRGHSEANDTLQEFNVSALVSALQAEHLSDRAAKHTRRSRFPTPEDAVRLRAVHIPGS